MASTTVEPVATAIAAVISGLSVSPAVTGYSVDRGPTDSLQLPAGVVGAPSIVRKGVDEKETQLGSRDWNEEWPISFAFELDNYTAARTQAVEVIEAFIKAIDADETLGGIVSECKVVRSDPAGPVQVRNRPMFLYDCTVQIFDLVP
jgi:hypothetical protein